MRRRSICAVWSSPTTMGTAASKRSCGGTSSRTRCSGRSRKSCTRQTSPTTHRIACPWLIRNFIDQDAEFLYVPADQVLEVTEREDAHSYDAPDAEYTHRDGLCSFEVLVEEYGLDDRALKLLARIVHGAD